MTAPTDPTVDPTVDPAADGAPLNPDAIDLQEPPAQPTEPDTDDGIIRGGEYELLHDKFDHYSTAEPGKPSVRLATYKRGDVVTLTDEQAENLVNRERPAFGKPGERAQAEADRLLAAAQAASDVADAAKARAQAAKAGK